MKKLYIISLLLLAVLAGCEEELEYKPNGEALYNFQLSGPTDNANVVLNSATPEDKVVIQWTAARTGVNAPVTYSFIAAQKGGNLETPLVELKSDNNGADTRLTLTQLQLDEALKSKGIADGAKADLIWSVRADNGSRTVTPEKPNNISITRFGNGVSNFILYGPKSSIEPIELDEDTPNETLTILWQTAQLGKAGVPVTYKWIAVNTGESFDTPLLELASDNNGTEPKLTLTQKQLNDALTAKGIARAQTIDLDWTVVATAGNFSKMSDYTNNIAITSFGTVKKMYLVGGATPIGWTVENAIEMIPSLNTKGLFTFYVRLNANDGFKFVNQRQWPGGDLNSKDWGTKDGKAFDGDGEQNIQSPATAGTYRITFNSTALTYDIKPAGMYLVGDATPNGWTVEQATPMTYVAPNKWTVTVPLTAGEFKFVTQKQWPGGSLNSIDWGVKDGKVFDADGEQNINNPTAGTKIITFDEANLTYILQ